MDTRSLKVGDRVYCNVRGQVFTATFGEPHGTSPSPPRYPIYDPSPKSITYRHVTSRQIVGKVEGQERLEVGA